MPKITITIDDSPTSGTTPQPEVEQPETDVLEATPAAMPEPTPKPAPTPKEQPAPTIATETKPAGSGDFVSNISDPHKGDPNYFQFQMPREE